MMALFKMDGVDALLSDLTDLAHLPDDVVDDILRAEANVLVKAQREEIRRQWSGPHSMGISAKSIKKDNKIKRDGQSTYINIYPQGTRKRGKQRVRNAEIAFINECGAPQRGIAARPAILDTAIKAEAAVAEAGEKVYHAYLDSKNL